MSPLVRAYCSFACLFFIYIMPVLIGSFPFYMWTINEAFCGWCRNQLSLIVLLLVFMTNNLDKNSSLLRLAFDKLTHWSAPWGTQHSQCSTSSWFRMLEASLSVWKYMTAPPLCSVQRAEFLRSRNRNADFGFNVLDSSFKFFQILSFLEWC